MTIAPKVARLFLAVISPLIVCAQPPADYAPAAPVDLPLNPVTDPPQEQVVPVTREYDRFQDKITLRVEGIRPAITKGDSRLFLTAICSCDGAAVTTKPTKVQLNVMAVSDGYQYGEIKDDLQLIFLITHDAQAASPPAVPLPRAVGDLGIPPASQQSSVRRVRVPARFQKAGSTQERNAKAIESFVAIVDADVLVQMATAPLVEGQLGGAEFKLGAIEQLSLRRFAEQVNLVAPLPEQDATALDRALASGPVRVDAVTLHMAQAKVDEAQENVDKLTTSCLAKLEDDKVYRKAAHIATELELRKDQTPAGPQRSEVSQQWLDAKAKASAIKASALLDDPVLADARRELADAQAALHALQRAAGDHGVRSAQK